MIPNLSISENGVHSQPPAWLADPFLLDVVSNAEIDRLRGTYARRSPEAVQRRGLVRGHAAQPHETAPGRCDDRVRDRRWRDPDHFYAYTDHHELQLMVQAGMSRSATCLPRRRRRRPPCYACLSMASSAPATARTSWSLDANPLDDIANTREDRSGLSARTGRRSSSLAI